MLLGIGVVGGFEAGAGNEPAESFFATGAALGADDEAVAVNHNINGVDGGGVHGGEIGVIHEDNLAVARMLLEIFFDGFLGFADIDGEKDEAFWRELLADFVDEGSFVGAVAAPGGPELEENDSAFDGVVGKFFAGGGGGVERRGRFFVLGAGDKAETGEEKGAGECAAEEEGSRSHEGKVAQNRGWRIKIGDSLLVFKGFFSLEWCGEPFSF